MDILLAFVIALFVLSAVHRPRGEPRRTRERKIRYSGTSLGPSMTLSQPRRTPWRG